MLAGRALQGVGAGFIYSLVEIVKGDLIPLSERYVPFLLMKQRLLTRVLRGKYQGVFAALYALAGASGSSSSSSPVPPRLTANGVKYHYHTQGPPIGGIMAQVNYRWLFYMNLPMAVGIIAIVGMFMDLKTPPGTMKEKLKQMDWYTAYISLIRPVD
jgi:MFS family permease